MNEAQKFLIENGLGDLVLNLKPNVESKDWVYVSDAIIKFQESQNKKQYKCQANRIYSDCEIHHYHESGCLNCGNYTQIED